MITALRNGTGRITLRLTDPMKAKQHSLGATVGKQLSASQKRTNYLVKQNL